MAWKIKYSNHLRQRIGIRNLPYDLAKDLLIFSTERYYDVFTKHFIAIGRAKYKGKEREFSVVYKENRISRVVEAITVHPLKPGQKENRIHNRRWIKK